MRMTGCSAILATMALTGLAAAAFAPAARAAEAAAPATGKTEASMKEARRQAAHRPRRIIMNNDGCDALVLEPGEPKTPEHFLSKRTSGLVGSQVDAIFYCTGIFNVYTHRSDESELYIRTEPGVEPWASALIRQGRDSLELVADFCHQHGMEVFWSMRMNDAHDYREPETLSRWKKDHPEYLMGRPDDFFPYGHHRWSAVNYAVPQVRSKVLRILRDVCARYDIDGVELDFYRHPVYFKPQMVGEPVTQQQCDMMTGLLRQVRIMTEQVAGRRGRPLLIAVRVPDSLGYAKAIGLDVARWLDEGLIDIMTGGGYHHLEPWENFVALGRCYDVPVYACLSDSRLVDVPLAAWRGEALRAWAAGVDGIYTFNRLNPADPIFRELGDPETLRGLEWTYTWNFGLAVGGRGGWLKGARRFLKPDTWPEGRYRSEVK